MIGLLERRMARIARRGFDLGEFTTNRMQQTILGLSEITDDFRKAGYSVLRSDFRALADDEVEFQLDMIDRTAPVKLEMALPARSALQAAVTTDPFDGAPLNKWFGRLARRQKEGLERAVRLGIAEGEPIGKIAQRIRNVVDVTRRQSEAIARTGTNHVATRARHLLYEENADLIKGMQWAATLDTRTCPQCMALDGKLFPLHRARIMPPAHVGCRCTLTPVFRSSRALGIDLSQLPEGQRASMTGDVPRSMTYPKWLRTQPRDVQNEALGPTRAKRWRAGKEQIDQFTDRTGRTLTLDQLRKREDRVRKAA
jgi:SPP1 gp7 family putative phage head morphogenesis protein